MTRRAWRVASCGALPLLLVVACGARGPNVPASRDDDLRALVYIDACVQGADIALAGHYMRQKTNGATLDIFENAVACAARSQPCDEFRHCLGLENRDFFDRPCHASCVDGVQESCNNTVSFAIDCDRAGMTCVAGDSQCAIGGAPPCDDATFVPRCEDGSPIVCRRGHLRRGPRCEGHGLRCAVVPALDGDPSNATCMGEGGACNSPHGSAFDSIDTLDIAGCDDLETARACVAGRWHTFSCNTVAEGASCVAARERGSNGAYACRRGRECDPAELPSCNGNTLRLCDRGRFEFVDCQALGFDACLGFSCSNLR